LFLQHQLHILSFLEELEIKEVFHLLKVILVEHLLQVLLQINQGEAVVQERLEQLLQELVEMVYQATFQDLQSQEVAEVAEEIMLL